MKALAIANQKGGTAKTTTAASLALLLSRAGHKIHMVDMDPQASLTTTFGQTDPDGLLYQALTNRVALSVVQLAENLSLTPSSIDLARGESQFVGETGREYLLKTCLEKTELPKGTTVVIDCPPSLGVLAVNCLTAAKALVVVVQPGGFELRALAHLEEVIKLLRERVNRDLKIVGGVLTNCHSRRGINAQVQEEIKRLYPLLGQVRADAKLLYATTEGSLLRLTRSAALDDYASVVERLKEEVTWLKSS